MIAIMNQSGLGTVFGNAVISLIGDSKNLYVITAILCIGSSIATQFMNNMACAGMLAPVGISIAETLGQIPRRSFWPSPLEPGVLTCPPLHLAPTKR